MRFCPGGQGKGCHASVVRNSCDMLARNPVSPVGTPASSLAEQLAGLGIDHFLQMVPMFMTRFRCRTLVMSQWRFTNDADALTVDVLINHGIGTKRTDTCHRAGWL